VKKNSNCAYFAPNGTLLVSLEAQTINHLVWKSQQERRKNK
jgi:hypothetical protein